MSDSDTSHDEPETRDVHENDGGVEGVKGGKPGDDGTAREDTGADAASSPEGEIDYYDEDQPGPTLTGDEETIDVGDQSEVPSGDVEIDKLEKGLLGDPGTAITDIEPSDDDSGETPPGQPGGDIPVHPPEATNAQNEQVRQERLHPDNRKASATINNSNREFDPDKGRFEETEVETELGPFADG